jgi:hypothetical protein
LDYTPAHPYSFLVPADTLLISAAIPPVNARDFKAEFTQFDAGMGFDGPRIKELDAFPPDCLPSTSGLVAWWRGENDGTDAVGDNDGALVNGLGFGQGLVGEALDFNAYAEHLFVPAAPELKVSSLTIEGRD